MLLHLYGPDSYRRGRAVREIVAKYQQKYPNGLVGYFCVDEDGAIEALANFVSSPGLFSKATLTVVLQPQEGGRELITLLKVLLAAPNATVLVVAEKKLPRDFAVLYGPTVGPAHKEFDLLAGTELLQYIKAESKRQGFVLTDSHIAAIGAIADGNLWTAMNEAARVAFGGVLPTPVANCDFFASVRTFATSSEPRARLRALAFLLEQDDPAKVFNVAASFMRGRDGVLMADYDIAIKRGQLEYEDALCDLAVRT